jgi:hypothetical protein
MAPRRLRWASPALQAQLDDTLERWAAADQTLGALLIAAERFDPTGSRGPVDPLVLQVLRIAVRLEGAMGATEGSPWLTFVGNVLRSSSEPSTEEGEKKKNSDVATPTLTREMVLATIHAAA